MKFTNLLILFLFTSCGAKTFQNVITIDILQSGFSSGTISVFDNRMGDGRDWVTKQGTKIEGQEKLEFRITDIKTVMIGDSSLPERIRFALFVEPITEDGFFVIDLEGREGEGEINGSVFVPFWGRNPAQTPELRSTCKVSKMKEGWNIEMIILTGTT